MEKQQQRRELTFFHSGDFLRQTSDRLMENSIDRDKSPIKEMDFFSNSRTHDHGQERKHESSSTLPESGVNVRSLCFCCFSYGIVSADLIRREFSVYDHKIIFFFLQTGLDLRTSFSGISRAANDDKPNTEVSFNMKSFIFIFCLWRFDIFGRL